MDQLHRIVLLVDSELLAEVDAEVDLARRRTHERIGRGTLCRRLVVDALARARQR